MTVFVPHYEDKVRIKDEKQKIRHMVLSCGNFVYVVNAASTKCSLQKLTSKRRHSLNSEKDFFSHISLEENSLK